MGSTDVNFKKKKKKKNINVSFNKIAVLYY